MTTQRLELLGTENHKMKKGLNPVFMSYNILSYHQTLRFKTWDYTTKPVWI